MVSFSLTLCVIFIFRRIIMGILGLVFYPIGAAIALLIILRTEKVPGAGKGEFDKISIVLNIFLALVCSLLCAFPMFYGMIVAPHHGVTFIQTLLGYLFSALIMAAPVYCYLPLAFSAALRRKGHSKKGFYVQFLSLLGIVFPMIISVVLAIVRFPWLNISIN